MSYSREQYIKTAQQTFTDENGVIRNGFYPVLDGEGNPIIVDGNIRVDHAWGSMLPMQPNEDREWNGYYFGGGTGNGDNGYEVAWLNDSAPLGGMDSHDIPLSEWDGYPGFVGGGAKYMITGASADGTTITYLSQNNLQAGDVVTITGLTVEAFNLVEATVASANAVKFTVTNSATGNEVSAATGIAQSLVNDGRTYMDGDYFIMPNFSWCDNNELESVKLYNVQQALKDLGADPAVLKDFTFSGGANQYDYEGGTPNYDGNVFWSYVSPTTPIYTDWLGRVIVGRDLNNVVVDTWNYPGNDVPTAANGGNWLDYAVIAFQSTNPNNNTAQWYWSY